ncbi:hypothetical protein AB6A40_011063 [Gnathostoma spinigerum]|uniref:Uncharacterized protein n=1 Tax=Gnathostoma spinigerum TaxID=75299 RepID=A0ABD6F127_9BILA
MDYSSTSLVGQPHTASQSLRPLLASRTTFIMVLLLMLCMFFTMFYVAHLDTLSLRTLLVNDDKELIRRNRRVVPTVRYFGRFK